MVPKHFNPLKTTFKVPFKSTEKIIVIEKKAYNHWLVQGANREFLANCRLRWYPHLFSIKDLFDQHLVVGFVPSKGPILYEIENIIASGFLIDEKYPDSVQILRNFILRNFTNIKGLTHFPSKNNGVMLFDLIKSNMKPKTSEAFKNYSSRPYTSVHKSKRLAPSIGFSSNKKYCIYVEDNNIEGDVLIRNINRNTTNKQKRRFVSVEDDNFPAEESTKNEKLLLEHYTKLLYSGTVREEEEGLFKNEPIYPKKTQTRVTELKEEPTKRATTAYVHTGETMFQKMFPQLPRLNMQNIDLRKESNLNFSPGEQFEAFKKKQRELKNKKMEAKKQETVEEEPSQSYRPLSEYQYRTIDPSKWVGDLPFR